MDEFNEKEIGRLLRLKRYEQPPPGYFEDFLHQFHRRQRDELLRQPLWQIAVERAQDFMMRLNVARLASYPVAVTAVVICAAVISLNVYRAPNRPGVARVGTAISPQAVNDDGWSLVNTTRSGAEARFHVANAQPRVRHSNLSTHRTATPPRYVLDSMPVSYESTLRF